MSARGQSGGHSRKTVAFIWLLPEFEKPGRFNGIVKVVAAFCCFSESKPWKINDIVLIFVDFARETRVVSRCVIVSSLRSALSPEEALPR